MKILFICDPISNFKIATDSTIPLMVAASELGHEVYYALPKDVFAINNQAFANITLLDVLITSSDFEQITSKWYKEQSVIAKQNLSKFDAVLVRNDPPFNLEYYYLTQILELAENNGVKVINNTHALRNFNEKLSILNFPEFITPTLVTRDKNVILNFLEEHSECVVKPLDQMAGRGVFKLSLTDPNYNPILELSTNYYTDSVMVQKFIPEVIYGDRRIFIVNGQVIPECLYRIPQQNQIRGNIAAGGRAEVHSLTDEDIRIAKAVASWCITHKILIAGIDIIGNKLTEINITSPTGIRQIFSYNGINIAKLAIDSLSQTIAKKQL